MDVHPPQVVERFRTTPVGEVMISVVTYAELRHGVERTPAVDREAAESALRRLVALLPVLPFVEEAANPCALAW